MVSPVFWGTVLFSALTGAGAYYHLFDPGIMVFLFVTSGWIVSLSLHEFGHALVAYLGGDYNVVHRGYLSLNPIRYTHGFLSIVLPILYLAIGGIGLPGGAVFINQGAIKSKRMLIFVAAAGPIMTTLFTIVLVAPFWWGYRKTNFYHI